MDREARSRLRRVVIQSRDLLEEDFRTQLKRLGIEEGGKAIPVGRLQHLTRDDRELREKILTAIHKEQGKKIRRTEAYDRYVRHVGFTYLNRVAALRAMEVRKLLSRETVARRDQYAGMSERAYLIAEREGLSDPGDIIRRCLLEAFDEVSQEIKVLFDMGDEYSLLFPSTRVLDQVIELLSVEVPEEDWLEDDIIGWIYQYYNSEARNEFRKKKRKPRPDDIPVISQFYTPRWIVRALVDNSLGRLWLEMKNRIPKHEELDSLNVNRLRNPQAETVEDYCSYLIPCGQDYPPRNEKSVREIKVLDPACGSGHFLVYSFDVLYRMYLEDEPETQKEEIPGIILENNLFGIDIDLRSVQLAALSLYLKAKDYNPDFKVRQMNLVCADARILDGDLQKEFLKHIEPDIDLQRIFAKLFEELEYTYDIGSLLRVRQPFERLINERGLTQIRFQLRPKGQFTFSKEGSLVAQTSFEKDREAVPVRPTVSLDEMLDALMVFEKEGMEKRDMGTMLFAAETEKSVGLLSLLSKKYDVIVMNPPHGRPLTQIKEYLNKNYPKSKSDYYSAFIDQAIDLCEENGFISALTGRSLLITKSFQKVREEILPLNAPPLIFWDLGFYTMEEAHARFLALTLRRTPEKISKKLLKNNIHFIRLTNFKEEEKKSEFEKALLDWERNKNTYINNLNNFTKIPGSPYSYWAPVSLQDIFEKYPPLDRDIIKNKKILKIADVKQGLAHADKPRFGRFWWEVNVNDITMNKEETLSGKKWVPYVDEFYLFYFYQDLQSLVLWEKNGKEIKEFPMSVIRNESFYFQSGLTWSANLQRTQLGTLWNIKRLPFRKLPQGCIFGVGAQGIIIDEKLSWSILAICCSKLIFAASRLISQDNKQGTGSTAILPIALQRAKELGRLEKLSSLAQEAHDIIQDWATGDEASTLFIKPWILQIKEFNPDEKPNTNHPYSKTFEYKSWPSLIHMRKIFNENKSLINILDSCEKRVVYLNSRLNEILDEIDSEVYEIYGISDDERKIIEHELNVQQIETLGVEKEVNLIDRIQTEEHIKRLISHYIKKVLDSDLDGIVVINPNISNEITEKIHNYLSLDFGEEKIDRVEKDIESLLGKSINEWIIEDYFDFHLTMCRYRPIYWHLTSRNHSSKRGSHGTFNCLINYHKIDRDTIPKIRTRQDYLKGILDGAKWRAERLRRMIQDTRDSGNISRERQLQSEYEEALDEYQELSEFDKKLEEVSKPRVPPTELDEDASWVERKIAEVRDNGYNPVIDYGVLVNITPLKEAGLLHPAADRVK